MGIMMMVRHLFIGLGSAGCLACSTARSATSYAPATPVDPPAAARSGVGSVPAGDISGTVVADEVRAPLDHAVIELDHGAAFLRGDSLGRFRFSDVAPGRHILHTRRIGYSGSVDTVTVLQSRDTAIVIALRKSVTSLSEVCLLILRSGLNLSVFPVRSPSDLPTVIPTVPRAASVVVSDRDFVERIAINSIPAQPDGVRRVYAAYGRPGTYQIEVSAPGFRPWRRTDVVVASTKCDDVVPVQLDVHLEALAGPPG